MKRTIFYSLSILLMFSCKNGNEEVTPDKDNSPVMRESYYNADGTVKATQSYEYNDKGQITVTHWDYTQFEDGDSETKFEYDNDGHQVKAEIVTVGIPGSFILETVYTNGLKQSETSRWTDPVRGQQTQYFYKGDQLDHTTIVTYPELKPTDYDPVYYYYDDMKRLTQKGSETYTYDANNRIAMTCNAANGFCHTNEYNAAGDISKIYEINIKTEDKRLAQEYIYVDGRLDEKRVYYGPDNDPQVTKIKYDY